MYRRCYNAEQFSFHPPTRSTHFVCADVGKKLQCKFQWKQVSSANLPTRPRARPSQREALPASQRGSCPNSLPQPVIGTAPKQPSKTALTPSISVSKNSTPGCALIISSRPIF